MTSQRLLAARLATLFLLGCLGFNAPPLRLVSREAWVMGLPLVWIYLFGVWALLIAMLALVVRPPRGE
jgi:hypothetical protein